jgi:ferrous iron transport protein B
MPCVATNGVIFKEIGAFWAGFSTAWSLVLAYGAAVLCYQLGNLGSDPGAALATMGTVLIPVLALFVALIRFGKRRLPILIPLTNLES